ncbi:MAG: gliding motility protein [Polyangiaceae bacterium]
MASSGRSFDGRTVASLNPIKKELVFKVVFCGPGLGGKTTTLEYLHASSAPESRGQLVSLATDSDRTLYFDFLPLRLPKMRGLHVRMQLFTVPGQVHYAATRKLVLTGADGVVFVADAQRARAEANVESLEDLETNLSELGRSLAGVPHVLQWNKTDLDDVMSDAELDAALNRHGAPAFRTVATTGVGVSAVLDAVTRAVVDAYWASVPSIPARPDTLRVRTEAVGIASAVRDWTEGQGTPGSDRPQPTERDLDRSELALPPLSPRKSASLVPPTERARSSSLPPAEPIPGPAAVPASAPPLPAPSALSLAELFPSEDRTDARGVEDLLGRGDLHGAVLACDVLVGRGLRRIAQERGTAWLLAGLPPLGFRAMMKTVEAAQRGEPIGRDAVLACFVWAAAVAMVARQT